MTLNDLCVTMHLKDRTMTGTKVTVGFMSGTVVKPKARGPNAAKSLCVARQELKRQLIKSVQQFHKLKY